MSEHARVHLDDVPDIPYTGDLEDNPFHQNGDGPHEPRLVVVPLQAFATTTEATSEPLLGTTDNTLLPAGGKLLMYGDGGAGKTTLTIDAVSRLAAGEGWIGHHCQRALRILIIENEGPRGKFRQILREKIAAADTGFQTNAHVLEEPWTRFTLADDQQRVELAHLVDDLELDLIILGPLATIGAVGGGTPEEINAFESLVTDLQSRCTRPVALWILHHENKSGDVSGAWERVPDTLLHVQAQGNGRTRLHWRKARWASTTHGTTATLLWAEGRGFTIEEKQERDLPAEILDALNHGEWRIASEIAKAVKSRTETTRPVLDRLVAAGKLEHAQPCPGRSPKSLGWRLQNDSHSTGTVGTVGGIGRSDGHDSHRSHLYKGERGKGIVNETGKHTGPDGNDEDLQAEADRLEDLYQGPDW